MNRLYQLKKSSGRQYGGQILLTMNEKRIPKGAEGQKRKQGDRNRELEYEQGNDQNDDPGN